MPQQTREQIRKRWFWFGGMALAILLFLLLFPDKLFNDPYATVLEDAKGNLLSAKIADDGQWRFPEIDSVPQKLEECITHFEDEYFRFHPGVNPVSTFRALQQNISAGKVISGGSTLSMQVIRLSRNSPPRTYWEKILEMYLALRMEATYSKNEILNLYVSHAPYGGNVVGAEAAAWRYFNRPLHQLSWAECAMLAVLPNSPALIHPGRNRDELKAKRDRLLKKLFVNEIIDSTTYQLATLEEIPVEPESLPQQAYHLLEYISGNGGKGRRVKSTIDQQLQNQLSNRLDRYVSALSQNNVKNACALMVEIESGEVKAYVGNASLPNTPSEYVDIVQSARSSGSILKPFLYGAAIEEGLIHPKSLLEDIPFTSGNFSPDNFEKDFDGMVAADEALTRSLNIPAVKLLKKYGLELFYNRLRGMDLHTIEQPPSHYGLTLILGGAEVTLWDLARAYTSQSQLLQNMHPTGMQVWKAEEVEVLENSVSRGAWWMISEALTQIQRPEMQQNWRRFTSSRRIAWKTGTSFGYRDAWAVGYDAEYLIAVWVGNADGEGRPGLTGVSTAAPLMFETFGLTGEGKWFDKPYSDIRTINVCERSGMAPSVHCPVKKVDYPENAPMIATCEFHIPVQLNESGQRVFRNCAIGNLTDSVWFRLPPVPSYFYRRKNPGYQAYPPLAESCMDTELDKLAIIYPPEDAQIIVPRDFNGQHEAVQLEGAHYQRNAKLFWHLDNIYLGSTSGTHKINADLPAGLHSLLLIDENGNSVSTKFSVTRD